MSLPLVFRLDAWILVSVLAVAMGIAMAFGVRLSRRLPVVGETDSTMEASVFAVVGLLLAFTFSMAGTRYDNQRKLIVEEANAIGTATLRADTFPDNERDAFRVDFREYLESRIADQEAHANIPGILAARQRTAAAQKLLWARAARLAQDRNLFVASNQMVPALTQMFDAAARRFGAERARVPDSIVMLLFVMCVASTFVYGLLAGRAKKLDPLAAVAFVIVAVSVVYVTLELDRPRRGVIDVSASEYSLVELRTLF